MKRKNSISKRRSRGFTLIELLVVISIIAILSVVVVLTLNPAELLRQAKDSSRISDLSTLKTALSLYLTDGNSNLASSSFGYSACYLSTQSGAGTTTAKCGIFTSAGITALSSSSSANYRKINSTGWVPVNFSQMSAGTPLGALPADPLNDKNHYYTYAASPTNIFELGTFIESKKFSSGNTSVVTTGTIYETGSTLTL
jgi:prepilin-type N-terminal cleavage/methylation domain-containing protein